MSSQNDGIALLQSKLVFAIRDGALSAVTQPKGFSHLTGIPVQELGTIADLRDDQRAALANVIAWAIDQGIFHFLYGLDNQPDGIEVYCSGQRLNEEGEYYLSDYSGDLLAKMSRFNQDGSPRPRNES